MALITSANRNCAEFIEQAFNHWVDKCLVLYQDDHSLKVNFINQDVFYGDEFEFELNSRGISTLKFINTFTGEAQESIKLYLSVDFVDRMCYKLKEWRLQNE